MRNNIYFYILVMALATWLMSVASSLVLRRPISNRFVQSCLYAVPYVTLAVMSFPAIVEATQSPVAGAAALIAGIVSAWLGAGLLPVATICCITVFILELFL